MADNSIEIVITIRDHATKPIQQTTAALTTLQQKAVGAGNATGGAGQQIRSMGNHAQFAQSHLAKLSSLAEGVLFGMLAFQAVRLPFQMISTAVQAYAAYERLGLTLKNLLAVEKMQVDSSLIMADAMAEVGEEAKELIKWTEKVAIFSPFTQDTVTFTLQTAMGYGMTSEMAKDMTQALADYAAGTGRSEEQTKLLGLALGQVWSKGRLTGEEMRQLTNAGMGVEFMATAAGMSLKDFTDMMKEGELDARLLIPRLIELSDERFAGAARAQATSWAGLLSTLDDLTKIGLRTFFEETLIGIQPHLANFLDAWPQFKEDLAGAGADFAQFGSNTIRVLGDLKDAWSDMGQQAQRELMVIGAIMIGPLAINAVGGLAKALLGLIPLFIRVRAVALIELTAIIVAVAYLHEQFDKLRVAAIELYNALSRRVDPDAGLIPVSPVRTAKDELARMGKDIENLLANVIPDAAGQAGDAMSKIWDAGVPGLTSLKDALAEVQREFSRTTVAMPSMEELAEAWLKTRDDLSLLDASMEDLIDDYERLHNVSIRVAGAQAEIGAKTRKNRPPIAESGNEAEKAAKAYARMVEQMRNIIASSAELINYLVSIDPAALAAAAAVDTLRLRLVGLRDQQAGLQESIRASQGVLRALQDQVASLGNALAAAKMRLADLAAPKLKGMGELDDQMAAIERQLKRLQMVDTMVPSLDEIKKQFAGLVRTTEEGGVSITRYGLSTEEAEAKLAELRAKALEDVKKQFPEMTKEMEDYLATLPNTAEGLQKILEKLRLTRELKFDEQLKKLADEARGFKEELTFEEALKQIQDTKAEIGNLEGQLAAAKLAAEAQTVAIEAMRVAAEEMTKAIQQVQLDLAEQESRQKLVNDALVVAYDWFTKDRLQLIALGDEAGTQAAIIDDSTRDLLSITRAYAEGEAAAAIAAISAALTTYRAARAEIALGLAMGGATGSTVSARTEWQRQRIAAGEDPNDEAAWQEHARAIGILAQGTRFWRGGLALVGEQGPELVNLPRGASVFPASDTRRMLQPTASYVMNVYANEVEPETVTYGFATLRALAGAGM